jgi:hypothetical protein
MLFMAVRAAMAAGMLDKPGLCLPHATELSEAAKLKLLP